MSLCTKGSGCLLVYSKQAFVEGQVRTLQGEQLVDDRVSEGRNSSLVLALKTAKANGLHADFDGYRPLDV